MITIDASAIIKVIITEENSEVARKAFDSITENGEPLLSPNIVFAESLSGLWKHHVLIKDIDLEKLEKAKVSLNKIYSNMDISSQTELGDDAIKLAIEHKITVYDAFYVALSISKRAPLLTFDKPLKEKAEEIGLELFNIQQFQ